MVFMESVSCQQREPTALSRWSASGGGGGARRSNDRLSERDKKSSSSSVPQLCCEAPGWPRCCGEEQAYAMACSLALPLELPRAPGSSSLDAAACTRRLRLGLLAGRSALWWLRGACVGDPGAEGRRLGGNITTTGVGSLSPPPANAVASTFLCFCGLGVAAAAAPGAAGQDSRPMRRATTPGGTAAAPSGPAAALGT